MTTIKPIETVYRGYRFRSRLEARWAVFFESVCLQWDYEPEGFDLGADGRYLPDFRFTCEIDGKTSISFAEIKGAIPTSLEISKLASLSAMHDCCATLLYGTPGEHGLVRTFPKLAPIDDGLDGDFSGVAFQVWAWLGFTPNKPSPAKIQQAITAARSARFEHGERPK